MLVVRVHELVPESVWCTRYDPINAFERHLVDNGTTIVKFFLAIDKEEQRQRFRRATTTRRSAGSSRWAYLEERKRWDDYQAAFDDALTKTSTDVAPWYAIPANRKWFRNWRWRSILADAIADLEPGYPPVAEDVPTNS